MSGAKSTAVILKNLIRTSLNRSRALEEAAKVSSASLAIQDDSSAEDGEYNHRFLKIFLPGLDVLPPPALMVRGLDKTEGHLDVPGGTHKAHFRGSMR